VESLWALVGSLVDDAFWVLGGPRPVGVVTQMGEAWERLQCRVGWHRMDREVVSELPGGLLRCSRAGCRQYRIRKA
jgi:hypothetical protein